MRRRTFLFGFITALLGFTKKAGEDMKTTKVTKSYGIKASLKQAPLRSPSKNKPQAKKKSIRG